MVQYKITKEIIMINQIICQLQKEMWMMEPKQLSIMFNKFIAIDPQNITAAIEIKINNQMSIAGDVAVINVHGLLMKSPPSWLAWYGIQTTDYQVIESQIAEALANNEVKSITLHIDSPGGTVAGVSEAAETISAANKQKPVIAYCEDLCASGAYYLASQAGKIIVNPNGEVGSIGVYSVYTDLSKMAEEMGVKVHVIKSGEHKGVGVPGAPITEEQLAAIEEVVNELAANFKNAVAKGRKMSIADVEKIADGRVFLASKAKELGLVDQIINGFGQINKQNENSKNAKGQIMTDEKNEPTVDQAVATAQKADKKRISDITEAFKDDPDFAIKQITEGVSLTEAKANYADVMKTKNTELEKQNADLKKEKEVQPEGADPIVTSDSETGGGQADAVDFMTESKKVSKEQKIGITEAMKQVQTDNPDSYHTFIEKSKNKKVKLDDGNKKRINK